MGRVAYVYFRGIFSGIINESQDGYTFIYDSDYILTGTPIGFNFPFSQLKYYSKNLFSLFENLISEGWLLDLQCRYQHIDKNDKLGILLNNGEDLIGAITILKDRL